MTLAAIVDRVLIVSAEKFPTLAALRLDPEGRVSCRELNDGSTELDVLRAGMRYSLVELLRVIGDITADTLTPGMHEALANAPATADAQGSR